MHSKLSENEIIRYSRQLILSNWSLERQNLIKKFSISIPASLELTIKYLSALGIGKINIYNYSDNLNIETNNPNCLITQSTHPDDKTKLLIKELFNQKNTETMSTTDHYLIAQIKQSTQQTILFKILNNDYLYIFQSHLAYLISNLIKN